MKKLPYLLSGLLLLTLLLQTGSQLTAKKTQAADVPGDITPQAYSNPENWVDRDSRMNIFYSYESWPKSQAKKSDDFMPQFIYNLKNSPSYTWVDGGTNGAYLNQINNLSINPASYVLLDLNGDGLMDMVYREQTYYGGSVDAPSYYGDLKMAAWTNQGNNNFALSYKCYMASSGWWYGDCAAI